MNIQRILNQHWYSQSSRVLTVILWPLSILFYLISTARKQWYRWLNAGSISKHPIIVVGNITIGGGGKTPVVVALTKMLQQEGYKPAVISRGYGRTDKRLRVVTNESSISDVGDEPFLIHKLTQAPVVVHANRTQSIEYIHSKLPEVNVIISDDGLQHYRMHRDYEIVIQDNLRGFGNGHLLPMGPLRELPHRLNTVDFVFEKDIRITQFRNTQTGDVQPAEYFKDRAHCIAVAGIANPEHFFKSLTELGIQFDAVPVDDHGYTDLNKMAPHPDSIILLTEKDAVKYPTSSRVWVAETSSTLPSELVHQIKRIVSPKETLS